MRNPSRWVAVLGSLSLLALVVSFGSARMKSVLTKTSLCQIYEGGARFHGSNVHLRADFIIDGMGGKLVDPSCPKAVVALADDGGVEPSAAYSSFNASIDRHLLTDGYSRGTIDLFGTIEAPGVGSGGVQYRSLVRMTKVVHSQFEPSTQASPR